MILCRGGIFTTTPGGSCWTSSRDCVDWANSIVPETAASSSVKNRSSQSKKPSGPANLVSGTASQFEW